MATAQEAVRRLSIQATTTGITQATAELKKLAGAQGDVAVASEKTERATLSLDQKFASIERRYVATVRAQQEYDRIQRQVNAAVAQNPALQDRANVVMAEAAERLRRVTGAANDNTKAVGLARHELVNLGRQAQDVGTMLAMGASPMQVFTSQVAQVFDIFSSSHGTMKGFISQMVGGLTSIVTPARLAFGGIASGALAAGLAVNSYLDAQQKVSVALTGAGRASGATASGINSIANAGSSTFGLSVSEAREMASAMAATGRIANDNILPIVRMGKDIAHAFGVDATEATQMLARAFADPTKGAETLNGRLGFMDAAMKRTIDNLVAQNRLWDAQRVLIEGAQSSLAGVADSVSRTEKGWTAVSNWLSNIWGKLGEITARAAGLERLDLSQQLEAATARLAQLNAEQEKFRSTGLRGGLQFQGDASEDIARQIELINKLNQKLGDRAAATARAQAAQKSFEQEAVVRQLVPEIAQRETLNNQLRVMEDLLKSLGQDEGAASRLKALGFTFETIAQAIEKTRVASRDFKTENERAAINAQISLDAVSAYSPTARADITRRQALEQYRGNPDKDARAQEAYTLALRQANEAIREQARERALSSRQSVDASKVEAALVGQGIAAQTEARLNLQTYQQLEQEAARNRTDVDEAQFERLKRNNAEQARFNELRAVKDLESRLNFERDTMFMSPGEQAIAREMNTLYGSKWQSHMDSANAKLMRTNELLREGRDTVSGFGNDLLGGLLRGEDAMKSLTSAASNLIQKLASANLNRLLNGGSLFGNQSLTSGAGLAGMASAGLAGYQSGSPLTGALGGALAGASFGPLGMVGGGILGALGGLFGGNSQRREQERQRAAQLAQQNAQERAALDMRSNLLGLDQSTRAGAVQATAFQQQAEYASAVAAGSRNLLQMQDIHRREMEQLNTEWDKRELEQERQKREEILRRQTSYQDRVFNANNDNSTLAGQLAALDRQYQREREVEIRAGGEALLDMEAAFAAERNKIMRDANDAQIKEQQRVARESLEFLQNIAKNVHQFLDGLSVGDKSILDPQARLSQAQSQFTQQLSLALSGDRDALGNITQYAGTLLEQARSFYASGEGYTSIYNAVTDGLRQVEGLAGSPTSANLLDAINQTTEAVAANNSLTTAQNALLTTSNTLSSALNSLTSSLVVIGETSRDHLNLMKSQLTGTFSQLTYSWSGGPGHATTSTFTVNNNLLDALNKIVGNTFAIAANTASTSAILGNQFNRGYTAAQGILADGGRIGGLPHSQGGTIIEAERDEFMIRRTSAQRIGYSALDYMNRTGRLPIAASVSQIAGNDNDRLFDGVAALARTNANGFSAVVAAIRDLEAAVYGGAKLTSEAYSQERRRPARFGT